MSKLSEKLVKDEAARLPYLFLAVSLLVTIGVTYNFYQSAKNKDTLRFNNEVARIQLAVENKVNLCIALLKGGRGFIESTGKLDRSTFANYVESLELGVNYAGVQGLGYDKIVAPGERENLVKQMNSEGFFDFQMFPETDRESRQAIIYFEPLNEKNRNIIGFDMSTEQNRREALERARDSGKSAASANIFLTQTDENQKETGFLIYLPIYKHGKIPPTLEEKRKNLTGYIYSPFQAGEFLKDIEANASNSDIAIKIYDGEIKPENLLVQTSQNQYTNFTEQIERKYSVQENIDVAGRNWTIKYDSLPEFAAQSSVGWTPLILLGGVAFSFLMFGMAFWEASARTQMQTTAAELFKLEQQKQGLLEKEQKARQAAERANKTKDEFIAVVSHELRTPLNAIAGWSRILKTDNLSGNTRKLALEKVDKNLRLQTQLVEELLEYSQIISEGISLEGKEVVFSKVFEHSFQKAEKTAQEKNIEFVKNNELNGHTISGDEEKIKVVMNNLFSNAIKFTDQGGRIETFVKEKNGHIQMVVKDNGKGITADFLPYIFDRFRQDDNSSTRIYGGLGLGLAISNHIVKLHNGSIEANSEGEGKGATFIVRFPYNRDNGK